MSRVRFHPLFGVLLACLLYASFDALDNQNADHASSAGSSNQSMSVAAPGEDLQPAGQLYTPGPHRVTHLVDKKPLDQPGARPDGDQQVDQLENPTYARSTEKSPTPHEQQGPPHKPLEQQSPDTAIQQQAPAFINSIPTASSRPFLATVWAAAWRHSVVCSRPAAVEVHHPNNLDAGAGDFRHPQPAVDSGAQSEEHPGAAISLPAPTWAPATCCPRGAPQPQLEASVEASLQPPQGPGPYQEAAVTCGLDVDTTAMLWWARFPAVGHTLRSMNTTSLLAAAGSVQTTWSSNRRGRRALELMLAGCVHLQKLPTIIAAALLPTAAACGSLWEAAKGSLGMSDLALLFVCLVTLSASICAALAGLAAYKGCSAATRTGLNVFTATLLCAMCTWAALTHKQQLLHLATTSQQQLVTWYHVFHTHVVPAMGWGLEWVMMMVAAGWPPGQQQAAAVIWWCAGFLRSSMPHVLLWARAFGTRLTAAMHLAALVGGWCARAASFQPFLEVVQFSGVWVAAAAVAVWLILQVVLALADPIVGLLSAMSSAVVHLVNLPATAVSWARQYGPPLHAITKQQTRALPPAGMRVSFSKFVAVQAMILPILPVLNPFAVTMAAGIGICAAAWDRGSIQHASTITASFFGRIARTFRPWHHQKPTAARMSPASAKPRRHQASVTQQASRGSAAEEDARQPAASRMQDRNVRIQRQGPQAAAASRDVGQHGSSSSRTVPDAGKPLGAPPGAAAVPGAASTPGSIPPKSEKPTPGSAISFSFTRQPCVGSPEQVPRMPLFGLTLAQGDSPSSWLTATAGGPASGAASSSIPVSAAAVASSNQASPAGHTACVQPPATAPASSVQAPGNMASSTSNTHGSSAAAVVQTAQQQGDAQSSDTNMCTVGVQSDAMASPHSGCAAGISSCSNQSDSSGRLLHSPAPGPTAGSISSCSSQSQSAGESDASPVTGIDAAQDTCLATDAVRAQSPSGQQAETPELAGVRQKLSFSPSSSNDSGDSRPRTPVGTAAGASQQPGVPLSPLEVTSPEGPGVTWSFNPVFYSMSGRPVPAHDALSSPPAANEGSTAGANPLADPWGSGMSVASSAGEAASEEGSPVAAGIPPAPDATTGPSVCPTTVGATEGPAAVDRVSGSGTYTPCVGEPRRHQPQPAASSGAASTAGAAGRPAPAAASTAATICGSGTGGPDSSSSANPVQGMANHARRDTAMGLSGGEATGSSCAQGQGLTLGHRPPHTAAAMSAAAISSGGRGVLQAAGRDAATCRPPPAHAGVFGISGESARHSSQQADVDVNQSNVQAGAARAAEAHVGVGSAASLQNDSTSVRSMQSLAGMPGAPAPAPVVAGSRAGLARAGLSIIIPNSNSASSSSSSSNEAAPTPHAVVLPESAQPGMKVCSTKAAGGLPPRPAPAAVKAISFFGSSSSSASRFGDGQAVNDVCSRTGTPQPHAASHFNLGCADPTALQQAVPSGLPGDTGVEGGSETRQPAGAAVPLSGSASRRQRVVPRRHQAGSHSATPGVLAAPGPL